MSRSRSPNPGGVTIHLTPKALEDDRLRELVSLIIERMDQLARSPKITVDVEVVKNAASIQ